MKASATARQMNKAASATTRPSLFKRGDVPRDAVTRATAGDAHGRTPMIGPAKKSAGPTTRTVSWLCPACKAVKYTEPRRTRRRPEPARNCLPDWSAP